MEPARPGSPKLPLSAVMSLLLALSLTACARDQILILRPTLNLPADGRTHTIATITRRSHRELNPADIKPASPELRFAPHADNSLSVLVRAPVLPGSAQLHFTWRDHRYTLNVRYVPDDADSHHDGLPDALHLHSPEDRAAFRAWFRCCRRAGSRAPRRQASRRNRRLRRPVALRLPRGSCAT